MDIVAVEAINSQQKNNPSKTNNAVSDGNFFSEIGKHFRTVEAGVVQKSYLTDGFWIKKNPFEKKYFDSQESNEEEFLSICREYKRILMKLYRIKHKLSIGSEA